LSTSAGTLWGELWDAERGQVLTMLGTLLADALLLAYLSARLRGGVQGYSRHTEELQKRISEYAILHEVSSTVHDLNSQAALQNIVEIATKVLGYRRAALFLTAVAAEVIPRHYVSYQDRAVRTRRPEIQLAPELFAALLKERGPLVIDGSQGSPRAGREPIVQLAVSLHGTDRPVGVLIVDNEGEGLAADADTDMLIGLTQSAVVAIENASLHHRLKQVANRDGLTELYNHRYFQECLREVLDRSEGAWPVSLLMIEIDRFKGYNDTYGHRQGDRALFALARALEQVARPWKGIVARYGGDEFVVVLVRVDVEQSLRIAQRVRQEAQVIVAERLARYALPSVQLSIGAATYPTDAQVAGDLIDAADQAMYVVKRQGGAGIRAYSESEQIPVEEKS
jgi:diguanylate cyclase (GGDEF)-like protein